MAPTSTRASYPFRGGPRGRAGRARAAGAAVRLSRDRRSSGAGVPEALGAAGVGEVPAQALLRRRARPACRRCRGDEADRRAGGDRAARVPPVPAWTADPNRARRDDDRPRTNSRPGAWPMHRRSNPRTVDWRTMAGTVDWRTVDGRPMHAAGAVNRRAGAARPVRSAVTHAGPAAALAHASDLGQPSVADLPGRRRPADNFDRLDRRRAESRQSEREQRVSHEPRPSHGATLSWRLTPARPDAAPRPIPCRRRQTTRAAALASSDTRRGGLSLRSRAPGLAFCKNPPKPRSSLRPVVFSRRFHGRDLAGLIVRRLNRA